VFACVLVQVGVFLTAPHHVRSAAPLGAGPRMLARIVALQVVLGAELGYRTISGIPEWRTWQNNFLPLTVAFGALLTGGLAWWRGPSVTRLAIVFGALMLTAALISPQISLDQPQWPLMTRPPLGNRYYLIPMVAWIAVVFTLTCDRARALRGVGAVLLLLLFAWGVPHDWSYPRMPPTDFVARARAFATVPPGTVMAFPQHPPGTSPMWLRKK
jgi:disulfide bond formation protein DsbB